MIWPEVLLATSADGFGYGALLALWLGHPGPNPGRSKWAAPVLAAATCVAAMEFIGRDWIWSAVRPSDAVGRMFFDRNVSLTQARIFAFGFLGLLICLSGRRWLAPLRHPVLVYLGTISYGLYLYHFPIFGLLSGGAVPKFSHDPMWLDFLKIALTLAVAAASWQWIERPISRMKDARYGYRIGAGGARLGRGIRRDAGQPANSTSMGGVRPAAAPRSRRV
jgi:peptidoglycan/LPS O-acetylase OafA/YrhL